MVLLLQQLYTRIYPLPIVMPILSNGCHYILLTAVVGRKIKAFIISPSDKRRKNPASVTNTKRQCVWHAAYIFLTNGTSFIACTDSCIINRKSFNFFNYIPIVDSTNFSKFIITMS